jgi:hypothetical protein
MSAAPKSSFVLGKWKTRDVLERKGEVTVSAYKTRYGDTFYTPVRRTSKALGTNVLYRIHVRLKT